MMHWSNEIKTLNFSHL